MRALSLAATHVVQRCPSLHDGFVCAVHNGGPGR